MDERENILAYAEITHDPGKTDQKILVVVTANHFDKHRTFDDEGTAETKELMRRLERCPSLEPHGADSFTILESQTHDVLDELKLEKAAEELNVTLLFGNKIFSRAIYKRSTAKNDKTGRATKPRKPREPKFNVYATTVRFPKYPYRPGDTFASLVITEAPFFDIRGELDGKPHTESDHARIIANRLGGIATNFTSDRLKIVDCLFAIKSDDKKTLRTVAEAARKNHVNLIFDNERFNDFVREKFSAPEYKAPFSFHAYKEQITRILATLETESGGGTAPESDGYRWKILSITLDRIDVDITKLSVGRGYPPATLTIKADATHPDDYPVDIFLNEPNGVSQNKPVLAATLTTPSVIPPIPDGNFRERFEDCLVAAGRWVIHNVILNENAGGKSTQRYINPIPDPDDEPQSRTVTIPFKFETPVTAQEAAANITEWFRRGHALTGEMVQLTGKVGLCFKQVQPHLGSNDRDPNGYGPR